MGKAISGADSRGDAHKRATDRDCVVVVTGPLGSGRSEFSRRLAGILGYKYVNVGDLLLNALAGGSGHPCRREEIGWQYIRELGRRRYFETLKKAARPQTVLDGVRSEIAVKLIRSKHKTLHVHRTGVDGLAVDHTAGGEDGFEPDLRLLEESADWRVGWFETVGELNAAILKRLATLPNGTRLAREAKR